MAGLPEWAYILLAAVVGVMGTARLTRLWVDDTWPPVAWLRTKYREQTPENWHDLADCAFCAAPWFGLFTLASGVVSDLHWTWWAFNAWLGGSYLASIVVVRDTPE